MSNKEDPPPKSILHGNDAFARKILSITQIGERSSRRDYFSDKQSRVPFTWEEDPGKPKPKQSPTHDFVPPISPPPSMLRPKPALKTQSESSWFFMLPSKTHKPKKALMMLKGNQHDDDGHAVVKGSDESHMLPSSSSSSSSRRVSRSSSMSSAGDSTASSSKLLDFAKGIHKWLF